MNNHAMYMRITMTTTSNLATSRFVGSVVCVRWGGGGSGLGLLILTDTVVLKCHFEKVHVEQCILHQASIL